MKKAMNIKANFKRETIIYYLLLNCEIAVAKLLPSCQFSLGYCQVPPQHQPQHQEHFD